MLNGQTSIRRIIALALAGLAALMSVIFTLSNTSFSTAERPLMLDSYRRFASASTADSLGIVCKDSTNLDSVTRSAVIGANWERVPNPVQAVAYGEISDFDGDLIASAYVSESVRQTLVDSGRNLVLKDDYAQLWSAAPVTSLDGAKRNDSPLALLEGLGVFTVMILLTVIWFASTKTDFSWTKFLFATVVFIVLSVVAMSVGLTAPNGLAVFAGKAKLLLAARGIPDRFFTAPEYGVYQVAYPPGLTLLSLIVYSIAGGAGEFAVKLLPPFAMALVFLELVGRGRNWIRVLLAFALVIGPIAYRFAIGFYAEPFAALFLMLGWRRLEENADDLFGAIILGFSAWFRPEGIVLAFLAWLSLTAFCKRPRRLLVPFLVLLPGLVWWGVVGALGGEMNGFATFIAPDLVRGGSAALALALAMVSCPIFGGVVLLALCAWLARNRDARFVRAFAFAILALFSASVALMFNTESNFGWMISQCAPRYALLMMLPLIAEN